jgi:putative membrane protein
MISLSPGLYAWIKALHVISVIAWMAGLLYLPRLFVYHAEVEPGSQTSETFKVMERRLLKGIMTPAMLAALAFGALLALHLSPGIWASGWWHGKVVCILALMAMHMMMARWQREFAQDRNTRPAKFYRFANEVPTVIMVAIVIFVVVKPF